MRSRLAPVLVLWATLAATAAAAPHGGVSAQALANATAPLPVGSSQQLLLVFARPRPGMQAPFDRWYVIHLHQFVTIPGVQRARRFTVLSEGSMGQTLLPSLVLCVVNDPQAADLDAQVAQRFKDGRLTRSSAVDDDAVMSIRMKPLGPALFARQVRGADSKPLGAGSAVHDYQFLVFSNPDKPADEQAYNQWYDHQHMPDVLRVPGFVAAQRFISVSTSKNVTLPRYLVIFTLRSRDLAATNAEVVRRLRQKITVMSPTMGPGVGAFITPVGPAVLAGSRTAHPGVG